MKYTENYNFKKPEATDTVNIDDLNENFAMIDEKLKETQDSNTNLEATFQQLIINAGSSNAEIVAGRHDNVTGETHASLPVRLDKFSAELAKIETQKLSKGEPNSVTPMMLTTESKQGMTNGMVAVVGDRSVALEHEVPSLRTNVTFEPVEVTFADNTYYKVVDDDVVQLPYAGNYRTTAVPVTAGQLWDIVSHVGSSSNAYGLVFADENNKVIEYYYTGLEQDINTQKYVPSGACQMLFTYYTDLTSSEASGFSLLKQVPKNTKDKIANGFIEHEIVWKAGNVNLTGESNRRTRLRSLDYWEFSGDYICCNIPSGYILRIASYNSYKEIQTLSGDLTGKISIKNEYPYYKFVLLYEDPDIPIYAHNVHDVIILESTAEIYGRLFGKSFSVIGDSYSAFDLSGSYGGFATGESYLPAGRKIYYDGTNAGVNSVNDMWWKKLSDKTGMDVLVIDAWSGSKVSSIDSAANGTPASDPERCQALHEGTMKPDVIINIIGTNDYTKANAAIGNWTGGSTLPADNNNFSNAYALMLSRMQEAYPDAVIYCCSLPVFVRTNTDKAGVEYNSEGKTIYDYNEVIRRMAKMFGCEYIDLQGCGITRRNMYPKYCIDNATNPTHYNALGHTVLCDWIIKHMI
jgi:lysophospholipase L1-like esterase